MKTIEDKAIALMFVAIGLVIILLFCWRMKLINDEINLLEQRIQIYRQEMQRHE